MNLIILFGPPASGKLTVGRLLSRRTGYPLLHNHLMVDLVTKFFPFGTKPFSLLNRQIRTSIIHAAVENQLPGLILTYVWALNLVSDTSYLRTMARYVNGRRGKTYFIELRCSEKTLHGRLKNKSRQSYGKIRSQKMLGLLLRKWVMNSEKALAFHAPHLILDTDRLTPKQAVNQIVRRFRFLN